MKILSIGNSFSEDAQRYLKLIAGANGRELTCVNLYIGGCSLKRHYINLIDNEKSYHYQFGGENTGLMVSIKEVLVLPFVPVRAIILSFSAGLPKKFALASASSILVFSTLSTIASEGSEISFSTANTRAPRE